MIAREKCYPPREKDIYYIYEYTNIYNLVCESVRVGNVCVKNAFLLFITFYIYYIYVYNRVFFFKLNILSSYTHTHKSNHSSNYSTFVSQVLLLSLEGSSF